MRSEQEIEALVCAARALCEAQAAYRRACDEGRLSGAEYDQAQYKLSDLERQLNRLKHNCALDRNSTGKPRRAAPKISKRRAPINFRSNARRNTVAS